MLVEEGLSMATVEVLENHILRNAQKKINKATARNIATS